MRCDKAVNITQKQRIEVSGEPEKGLFCVWFDDFLQILHKQTGRVMPRVSLNEREEKVSANNEKR